MTTHASPNGQVVAFFDFDGTLAESDSLWPFVIAVAGKPRCFLALLKGALLLPFAFGQDRRTIVKSVLLSSVLKGRSLYSLSAAIERMRSWPRWLPTVDALRRHHAQGHRIVIATGSLGLYVKEMLGDVPYDAILATEMEVVDGVLTGRMLSGNCVRRKKAERVADYLIKNGPFQDSWAYGNVPHDLPMMGLTNHAVVI